MDNPILIQNVILALVLIIVGIGIGRISYIILSKLVNKFNIKNNIRESFLRLFLSIIEWSIYIIFIDLALKQLDIPLITGIITKVIIVIPAITSALLLIGIGTGIAFYLREVIEDSEILGWKMISMYFFYFILYVCGIYSLKIALISVETVFVNIFIAILTLVISVSLAYYHLKLLKEKGNNNH